MAGEVGELAEAEDCHCQRLLVHPGAVGTAGLGTRPEQEGRQGRARLAGAAAGAIRLALVSRRRSCRVFSKKRVRWRFLPRQ